MSDDEPPSRRRFLKLATCGLGGGVGAVIAAAAAKVIVAPAGRAVVTTPERPVDIAAASQIPDGGDPVKIAVIAPAIRDAWSSVEQVALGSAWLRRSGATIEALSASCPHLGCAIRWSAQARHYQCPCHDSAFAPDGKPLSGPAERGLDPLPLEIVDGRIHLRWIRYRSGGHEREPV
jgi:Rieske Fe-S protein